jgi:hypothetical protein
VYTLIAPEEGMTVQALLTEDINAVCSKRSKPEIAELPAVQSMDGRGAKLTGRIAA